MGNQPGTSWEPTDGNGKKSRRYTGGSPVPKTRRVPAGLPFWDPLLTPGGSHLGCTAGLPITTTRPSYVSPSAPAAMPPPAMAPMMPEMFHTSVSISDVTITLSSFTGINSNQEEVEQWLHSLKLYTDFEKMSDSEKLGLFQLLMKENAGLGLRTLPQINLCTIHNLITAFKKRYIMTRVDKWKKTTEIWSCQ
jgi:hypothetical protein